jgi:cytochrome c oxidase cbb3-type subunit III
VTLKSLGRILFRSFKLAALAALFATQALAQAPAAQPPAGRGGRGEDRTQEYPQHPKADPATFTRGQQLFSANCSFCHGSDARGGEGGPNLLRSQLVLHDQNGEAIAVVVQNGRADLGMPKFDMTTQQVSDIAAFIHSFVVAGYDPTRDPVASILVGNAKAGEAYFNGPGKCNTCHSVAGDLAGIGSKMDPKALQNALVSGSARGRGAAVPPTTVKVTLPSGKTIEGKLYRMDDYTVSLTDANGNHLSFVRDGDVPKVEVQNPLQAHLDMLSKLSDDDMHNLTAYLVTVK